MQSKSVGNCKDIKDATFQLFDCRQGEGMVNEGLYRYSLGGVPLIRGGGCIGQKGFVYR